MAEETPAPATMTEDEKRALALFNELWRDNSEAGRALRAKAKEKYPEARLPEEVAEPLVAPLRAELEAMRAERAAEKEEREAEKAAALEAKTESDLRTRLDGAVKRYNLTDTGLDMAVARMKEQNSYDVDAAAAWVAQQTPPPQAPGPYLGPQNINLFGSAEEDPQFALLHKDPSGRFLDEEFRQFTADPDKYVRDAGFA